MPGGSDAGPAAALKRVVEADDDRAGGDKGGHDLVHQDAGKRQAGPGIAVEHAMKGREAGETRRVCAGMVGEAQGA